MEPVAGAAIPVGVRCHAPRVLTRGPNRRVHLATAAPTYRALIECRTGTAQDVRWRIPGGYRAGDVVVTVVDARERVVLSCEVLGVADSEASVVFEEGVSVAALELVMGETLPDAPITLDDAYSDRLLSAISTESSSPTPWQVTDVDGCVALDRSLPAEVRRRYLTENGGHCAVCEVRCRRPRKGADPEGLEMHKYGDHHGSYHHACLPLCTSCHARAHRLFGPSVTDLMFMHRPPCPRCGIQRALDPAWGEWEGPVPPATTLMGCVILAEHDGVRWKCGVCAHFW